MPGTCSYGSFGFNWCLVLNSGGGDETTQVCACPAHSNLCFPTSPPDEFRQHAAMTDDQYRSLIIHIRALIVLLGMIAGILIAFAWA
jgi:hypothetical protein